ncbi:MAG: restriction endonuclease subunit S [Ignavibacteria bacterium]|nr:restriction endonuclease subunit S [Ignavibacteria bacterium]
MDQFTETIYGKIPSSWQLIPSLKFCIRITDGTHDSPKEQNIGKYLITSKHIKGRNIDFDNAYFINEDDFNKINLRSKVDQWDVIISMIGEYCGFSYVERNEIIDYAVKNVGILKAGNEHKALWLYYFLNSKIGKFILDSNKSGTSQPYLTLSFLRDFPILYPKYQTEAESIIDILSSLDDKIDLLHRQNKTLEALAETLFRQWFIEEADESWEEVKVRDVCKTITKGTTPTTLGFKFTKTGINFLKAESITDLGDLIESKFAFIDDVTHNALNRSKIEANDVIITIAGTIGRVAIVTERFLPANTNQAIALLRVNKDSISPYFLYYLLKSRDVVNDFESRIVHAVQPNLSLGEIGDISFKMPEKNKLMNGESVLKQLFDKKEKNNVQIRTLTKLRDTLLPKLMSGEVRMEG